MSFVDLPMDPEDIDKPVPEAEYELVISEVKEQQNDAGELKGFLIIHDIVGHPDNSQVLHNMSLPLIEDNPDKVRNKLRYIQRYCRLFNIDMHGGHLNSTEFFGKRATCKLEIQTYEGTDSNKIKLK